MTHTLPRKYPRQENIEPNRYNSVKINTVPTIAPAHLDVITPIDDKIKVYLRVRPPIGNEASIDYTIENQTITIRPNTAQNSSYFCVDKFFTFRDVFGPGSTQESVFDTVAKPLLNDFLDGSDVLIFCYGSTNAGKTYTVNGTERNPGLMARSLSALVPELLNQPKTHLLVSFIEIYNERVFDLLSQPDQPQPSIGLNKFGDTEVKNVHELEISSIEDIQEAIAQGNAGRHRGSTEFNCDSSRSHTIFRMRKLHRGHSNWLSIVDLAGCERLSVMNSTKGSFKEACNINKSMLTLGRCIRALKEAPGSIPYRESKLTHLFKNFFEPQRRPSKAAMVVNISPANIQIDDTIFALQFAAEASDCQIRQIARPEGELPEEEEEDTWEEIEAEIEAKVQDEMNCLLASFAAKQPVEPTILQATGSFDNSKIIHLKSLQKELGELRSMMDTIMQEDLEVDQQINDIEQSISDTIKINETKEQELLRLQELLASMQATQTEILQSIDQEQAEYDYACHINM